MSTGLTMHGTTERGPASLQTDPPASSVADGAAADGDPGRADTAALSAALSALETAIATRRQPAADAPLAPPRPYRPPAAPHPQAIRRPALALAVVSIARSPAAGRALRAYEAYEERLDRAATAAGRRAWATLGRLPRVIVRPAKPVQPRAQTAKSRAATGGRRDTRGRRLADSRWPFVEPEAASISYPKRRPGASGEGALVERIAGAIPLLLSIGVVAIALGCYSSSLTRLFNRTPILSAPTLMNRPLAEARDAAQSMGLTVEVARVEPSDQAPKDTVLDQSPRPGLWVEPGGVVKLTVSSGLLPPSVVGKTVDQARVQLIIEGWKPNADVETRIVAGAAPNVVIDQLPRPDQAMPQKGTVTLVVGAPNLAHRKSVRTSGGNGAPEVVDGQAGTHGPAWTGAPSWLEIDFGGPISIGSVNLLPALERPGGAVVELWAWDASGRFFPIFLVNQQLEDSRPVTARLTTVAGNVVRLRVATTAAAGPLGWREVTVLGP